MAAATPDHSSRPAARRGRGGPGSRRPPWHARPSHTRLSNGNFTLSLRRRCKGRGAAACCSPSLRRAPPNGPAQGPPPTRTTREGPVPPPPLHPLPPISLSNARAPLILLCRCFRTWTCPAVGSVCSPPPGPPTRGAPITDSESIDKSAFRLRGARARGKTGPLSRAPRGARGCASGGSSRQAAGDRPSRVEVSAGHEEGVADGEHGGAVG